MRTNVILIDFESVQPESLALLAEDHYKVLVFVGASQAKLPFEVAASMQRLGERAEYIRISGNGPNALDFHIAYYLGKLAATDGTAYFHIISKDTGFDPLIQHLISKGAHVGRVTSIAEIPLVKVGGAKSPRERFAVALEWPLQTRASRPRTIKTLSSSLNALFLKQLSSDDIDAIIAEFVKHEHIVVAGTKIAYACDGANAHAAAANSPFHDVVADGSPKMPD